MEKNIIMPALSPDMKKAVLASWNKDEGDEVKKGDILFEVETDKVVSEVEAMDDGVLTKLLYDAGDEVAVNDVVAVLNCRA